MKEKGVTKIALILLVLVCMFAVVACSDNVNTDGDACKHIYTEKADATYLKSAATCTEKAVYYKSCSLCGEKDTATFEYGEALGHAYGDWVSNGDGTHTKTCANDATHKITENCSGGTATCTERATCEICNARYGEALGHAYGNGVSNGDGTHTKTCANDATHKITENCSGGTATCTERATCEICNAMYGDVEHAYSAEWSYNSTYHWKVVTCGCDVEQNYVKHTLDDDGKCTICKQQIVGTEGVAYESYDTYAVVTGYTGTESDVKIAALYKDLPVTRIENKAFYECRSLTSVTIPDSVKSIGEYAFKDCTLLESVSIPNSVTSIGYDAFYACYKLIEVKNLSKLNIRAGSSHYGYVGYYAKRVYTEGESYLSTDKDGYIIYDDGKDKILVGYTGTATDLTLPSGITQIYKYAFYYCTSLTSVTIPDSVTSIGNWAFYNCTSLTSVSIPDSVTRIGNDAFYACYKLIEVKNLSQLNITAGSSEYGYVGYYAKRVYTGGKSYLSTDKDGYIIYDDGTDKILVGYTGTATDLTLPSGITQIYKYAFFGCTSLKSITIPDSVTSIGVCAFYNCTSLTSVTIGNSVTSIGEHAFYCCTSLTSVTIPDSVTNIGNWAFSDCKSLKNVSIGNNVTSIGYDAFYNCTSLTSITIPDSVKIMGDEVFRDCTSLTSVSIGNGVTNIGNSAFSGCKSLASVTIGNGVTSIGNWAFWYCRSLTSITIPDNVTSIGEYTFYNCMSLTSVTIGNGVTSIGDYAFEGCSSLTSVTIGNGVTGIGEDAFYDCTSLKTVYYKGTAADWKKISISYYGNYYLTDATRYYYSESKPAESGNYWHYVDGKPTVWPSDE